MNQNQTSQDFHDAFTEVSRGMVEQLAGQLPPEEITRAVMLGAASFTAAAWAASSKVSGVDHAMTKVTMAQVMRDFYDQAVIPQTFRV